MKITVNKLKEYCVNHGIEVDSDIDEKTTRFAIRKYNDVYSFYELVNTFDITPNGIWVCGFQTGISRRNPKYPYSDISIPSCTVNCIDDWYNLMMMNRSIDGKSVLMIFNDMNI